MALAIRTHIIPQLLRNNLIVCLHFLIYKLPTNNNLGCSESYNWNKYKSEVTGAINSQGREQMHSTLSKLGNFLRQKNFKNFKNHLIAFFAINNLRKMQQQLR